MKKRKLDSLDGSTIPVESNSEIERLEQELKDSQSQKHLNNIVLLLKIAENEVKISKRDIPAVNGLCRAFSRLIINDRLSASKLTSTNEKVITEWLSRQYDLYKQILDSLLENHDLSRRHVAMKLSMALVQAELDNAKSKTSGPGIEHVFKTGIFGTMLDMILWTSGNATTCQEFAKEYVQRFVDVRQYTFITIAETLGKGGGTFRNNSKAIENSISILSSLEFTPDPSPDKFRLLSETPESKPSKSFSYASHRKHAQRAWSAVLGSGLTGQQRKLILNKMKDNIVPWFPNVELLMDFLTDSYNVGGATSLLSLSGLFHLIQTKNLDYPDFYKKLYSLLDHQLMQSKHRSRFFRLLNIFMSSTHLPSAMVASFIKRLSRLALHAPPGGIVAVIPWIYNMLNAHPTCTFMIHREPRSAEERAEYDAYGMEDPFDMEEADPMLTNAIDSCLWELVSLQSHYHPNVASLAKIVSEQFTKKEYNIEDFLDHSYGTLIESELQRPLKDTPVVEYEIPKNVFLDYKGEDTLGSLLEQVYQQT